MNARNRYDSLLQFYGAQYRVDWHRLKAQMLAESAGDPDAVSPVGAMGLTQFMRATWHEWWDGTPGIQAPTPQWSRRNPEAAIRAQAAYMRWLLNRVGGDYRAAFAAYNWGIGRMHRLLTRHPTGWAAHLPQETQAYLQRIARLEVGAEAT